MKRITLFTVLFVFVFASIGFGQSQYHTVFDWTWFMQEYFLNDSIGFQNNISGTANQQFAIGGTEFMMVNKSGATIKEGDLVMLDTVSIIVDSFRVGAAGDTTITSGFENDLSSEEGLFLLTVDLTDNPGGTWKQKVPSDTGFVTITGKDYFGSTITEVCTLFNSEDTTQFHHLYMPFTEITSISCDSCAYTTPGTANDSLMIQVDAYCMWGIRESPAGNDNSYNIGIALENIADENYGKIKLFGTFTIGKMDTTTTTLVLPNTPLMPGDIAGTYGKATLRTSAEAITIQPVSKFGKLAEENLIRIFKFR